MIATCCVCGEPLPEQTRGRPRQRCEPCAAVAVAVDSLRRAIERAADAAPSDRAALRTRRHIAGQLSSALCSGFNGPLSRARVAAQKARQGVAPQGSPHR